MGISELEKVVRETTGKKDLHSIEETALPSEFAEAARTLGQRKGKKSAVTGLLNPTIAVWY